MPRVERPEVVCDDCGESIPVHWNGIVTESPRLPKKYVCETCRDEGRDRPEHLAMSDVIYTHEWRPTEVDCMFCSEKIWSLGFTIKMHREIRDGENGELQLLLKGTPVEFTECCNPGCEFAWGSSRHHDTLNYRYQFLLPPWVEDVYSGGLEDRMQKQIVHHGVWYEKWVKAGRPTPIQARAAKA